MCAILDANIVAEVFAPNQPPAGKAFFDWVNKGIGRLVVGGKLGLELSQASPGFRRWAQEARRSGVMRVANEDQVNARTRKVHREGNYASDDPHILALAQVSAARLLYSNDSALQQDFKNKALIDNPRGSVYSTLKSKSFSTSRRKLLMRTDLCQAKL